MKKIIPMAVGAFLISGFSHADTFTEFSIGKKFDNGSSAYIETDYKFNYVELGASHSFDLTETLGLNTHTAYVAADDVNILRGQFSLRQAISHGFFAEVGYRYEYNFSGSTVWHEGEEPEVHFNPIVSSDENSQIGRVHTSLGWSYDRAYVVATYKDWHQFNSYLDGDGHAKEIEVGITTGKYFTPFMRLVDDSFIGTHAVLGFSIEF